MCPGKYNFKRVHQMNQLSKIKWGGTRRLRDVFACDQVHVAVGNLLLFVSCAEVQCLVNGG